jgi:Protein of unknown function (DUF5818)
MPHDKSGAGSVGTVQEPLEKAVPSEAEFAELVRQHRAKVLNVNGRLLWDRHQLVLMLDGGGSWVLDGPAKLSRLVGQRVTVEGTRFDFNGINVQCFKTEGADWPPESACTKFKRWCARQL